MFDAQALGADGNTAIGAELQRSPEAPNTRPPRAARSWVQNGPFFFLGEFPGLLRGHVQFTIATPMKPMPLPIQSRSFRSPGIDPPFKATSEAQDVSELVNQGIFVAGTELGEPILPMPEKLLCDRERLLALISGCIVGRPRIKMVHE
jgi:hypothetical protein